MDERKRRKTEKINQKAGRGIVRVYFLLMTVVYPLYAPGGYARIGEVKYLFFRNVSLAAMAALGITVILSALFARDREWIVRHYRHMSVTDWLVYGYCLIVMLSYLCSPYKEVALWGTEGWYMGVMSQIMFVLVYFFFSHYFCHDSEPAGFRRTGDRRPGGTDSAASVEKWLYCWLLASSVVFILGICNRYSLYPVAMEGRTETFISTLGNINWFCGYWSVAATVGVTLYWCGRKGAARILLGIYSFIAMLSGITQGSNSAYLVFLVMLLFLFAQSLRDNGKLYRFLELCLLFVLAIQVAGVLRYVPGLSYNYRSFLPEGGLVFVFLLGGSILLRVMEKKRGFCIEGHRWLRCALTAAVVAAVGIAGFRLLAVSEVIVFREIPFTMERDSYLKATLNEDWGNGRGATWKCGVDAYRNMDTLHKAVGIGPDCFADYIYDVPELAQRMVDRFGNLRLTNAHNEWLTVLVNMGAAGLLCYVGIFLTGFVRYLRKAGEQPLLYVCAAALLAYTAHNMVSFQQVLNTPYIFMILGIGEGLRRSNGETESEQ